MKEALMISSSEPIEEEKPSWDTLNTEEKQTIKARHDECSRNIRGIGLALLSYALFCFLTLLQPDAFIFRVDQNLAIPFGNLPVGSITFLWIGPLILIILTSYLHIFISEWLNHNWIPHKQKLPFVFNLETNFSRSLTYTLFYFIPPVVLLAFVQKSQIMGKHWVSMLAGMGLLCTVVLLSLFYKIKGKDRRFVYKVSPLLTVFLFFVYLTFGGEIHHFIPINISKAKNLKEIDFREYHLNKMNAEEAHLENAKFAGNQNLRHSNFSRAYLSGATFEKANLHGALFKGTNLKKTKLNGAILSSADFTMADLSELDLSGILPVSNPNAKSVKIDTQALPVPPSSEGTAESGRIPKGNPSQTAQNKSKNINSGQKSSPSDRRANLENAILNGAIIKKSDLSWANLTNAKLKGAILPGTNLSYTTLINTDFSGANLAGANFNHANFSSADLTGATIEFVDFTGAIGMETVKGLNPTHIAAKNWDRALYDNQVRKNLNITNERLSDIIPEYVNHHFEQESQEFKDQQIQDWRAFYELGDQNPTVSNITDNVISNDVSLSSKSPLIFLGSNRLQLSTSPPTSSR